MVVLNKSVQIINKPENTLQKYMNIKSSHNYWKQVQSYLQLINKSYFHTKTSIGTHQTDFSLKQPEKHMNLCNAKYELIVLTE